MSDSFLTGSQKLFPLSNLFVLQKVTKQSVVLSYFGWVRISLCWNICIRILNPWSFLFTQHRPSTSPSWKKACTGQLFHITFHTVGCPQFLKPEGCYKLWALGWFLAGEGLVEWPHNCRNPISDDFNFKHFPERDATGPSYRGWDCLWQSVSWTPFSKILHPPQKLPY